MIYIDFYKNFMNYIASWAGRDDLMKSISSNKGGFYYSGHLLQVSEKTALYSILYRFFHDFIHAGPWADFQMG